jgi:pheromone shutdown protein TraB
VKTPLKKVSLPQLLLVCKFLEKHSEKKKIKKATSLSLVLVLAQCFAIMPVNGITHSSPSQVQFQWYLLRTVYTIVYLVCALLIAIALLEAQLTEGITARNIGEKLKKFITI